VTSHAQNNNRCDKKDSYFSSIDYIDGLEQQQQEAIIDEAIEEVNNNYSIENKETGGNGTQAIMARMATRPATRTKLPLPLTILSFATGRSCREEYHCQSTTRAWIIRKKMARMGTTPATRTKMPLPSIRLSIGRVGCVLCVPESIAKDHHCQ
jgi:hypothetical protein